MKSGFTLIEFVIAFLIASMIAIGLYQLLAQTRRGVNNILRVIEIDQPLAAFYNQLERDIIGMFAPASTKKFYVGLKQKKPATQAKPAETPAKPAANQNGKPAPQIPPKPAFTPAPTPAASPKPGEEKEKKIENSFYIESMQEGQIRWSFITTAAVQTLDKDGNINPVPYMRRVAYILQKDPDRPGTLKLVYRYSTQDLELDGIMKPTFEPSYVLMDGIKNLTVEFTVFEKQTEKGADSKESKSVLLTKWNEKEIFEKYETLLPAYITFKGSHTDALGIAEYPFQFDFKILTYTQDEQPQQAAPPPLPAKVEPKLAFKQLTDFFDRLLT